MKKACRECPFSRTSVAGYLGSATNPEDFIGPHWHADLRLPCHMKIDWDKGDAQEQTKTVGLCHGFLVMSKNSCKSHLNPEVREAQRGVEADRDNFFSMIHEFKEHHGGAEDD